MDRRNSRDNNPRGNKTAGMAQRRKLSSQDYSNDPSVFENTLSDFSR